MDTFSSALFIVTLFAIVISVLFLIRFAASTMEKLYQVQARHFADMVDRERRISDSLNFDRQRLIEDHRRLALDAKSLSTHFTTEALRTIDALRSRSLEGSQSPSISEYPHTDPALDGSLQASLRAAENVTPIYRMSRAPGNGNTTGREWRGTQHDDDLAAFDTSGGDGG